MPNKPTLVFLHGFLESKSMWDAILPSFIDYHTVALDLPGHGDAPVLGTATSMEEMAHFIQHQLELLNIKKAIFIGHSMGGYVSLEIGKLYPELVAGISLFFSTASNDSPQKQKDRERAARIVETNKHVFIREAIPFLFTETSKKKHKVQIENLIRDAQKTDTAGVTAALRGMKTRADNTKHLESFPFPIQYILGKMDPVIPLDSISNQINASSVTDVEVIDDCGHMGHIEAPAVCIESLMRFIKSLQEG